MTTESQLDSLNWTEQINYWSYYFYGKLRSYVQPYISTEFTINKINDNLYIGDFASACNYEELLKLGITHVVTAIIGVDPMYPDYFTYKTLDICDATSENIYKYFDDCSKFIDEAIINGGKVYIHCICGISRSATIAAAYLINKYGYNENKAIDAIKECRNCVNPNEGFRQQLKLYYDYIIEKNNV